MPFLARAIPFSKKDRTPQMRGYLLHALRYTQEQIEHDLYLTAASWEHSVTFTVRISFKADAVIRAWTDDYVWNLLNVGTLRRYARTSDDFTPKTAPGRIVSLAGSGSVYPSRVPLRGIDAREWTITILRYREKFFNQRVVAAIAKGFR